MALKFSDVPQVTYGKHPNADDWRNRFPAHSQPLATAPERSASPVWVYEPSGEAHRAVFYRGQWQKVGVERDPRDGTSRLRMTGETVMNPVRWASS
jgi:hypothetical protein